MLHHNGQAETTYLP